jgi:hypothetical protein
MVEEQTAVNWLVDELMKESTGHISLDHLAALSNKALRMQKDQHNKTFIKGIDMGRSGKFNERMWAINDFTNVFMLMDKAFDEYYFNTFNRRPLYYNNPDESI